MEASHYLHWAREPGFLCPCPPAGRRGVWGPFLCQRWWGGRPRSWGMPGLSPWQRLLLGSQRWGLWKGPSPMQMLPGEKRPLGPPAHPPGFVTRSPSLQRQNNTPGLTERETMNREEGDYHQCPPPIPASLGRGAGDRGEVVVDPPSQLLPGEASLPGGPAHTLSSPTLLLSP